MSNFVEAFSDGKKGLNLGLTTGIPALDYAINGIQKKNLYGLAAAQKVGKTTAADFCFVLSPYLQLEKEGRLDDANWIYWSLEVDRVSKEANFAAFFMAYDFGVTGYSYKDRPFIPLDSNYILGRKMYRNTDGTNELIPVSIEHEEMLKVIYVNRIVPLFGEYDKFGKKIKKGKIDFIEASENPTGIYKYLKAYAEKNGKFLKESYNTMGENSTMVTKERIYGYTENNPRLYTIVITDHIRKPQRERGFTIKENIDKLLEYHTEIRNLCKFTFVDIGHMNRGISNIERLKFFGEQIFPTADDVKDSGNLAEEATVLITMFNALDEKYNLSRHMGVDLKDTMNYNYRSMHVVDARYVECPVHIQVRIFYGINTIKPF